MSLAASIAKVGEDPNFIAFNAHCWFAYALVFTLAAYGVPTLPVCVVVIVVAGIKEFWFDATQEKDPPQTFADNLEDFAGYVGGALLAVVVVHFT